MNYVGLKIETKKMIEAGATKKAIINFVNTKWEDQPYGFSKRIESMQTMINTINAAGSLKTKKAFYNKINKYFATLKY